MTELTKQAKNKRFSEKQNQNKKKTEKPKTNAQIEKQAR